MITAEGRIAISRVNLRDQLVMPQTADTFIAQLTSFAQMNPEQAAAQEIAARNHITQIYGFTESAAPEKPFIYNDGVSIIPIHGVLLNRFSRCWGFVTGYGYIRTMMNAALEDDDVKLIVYDVDSPGGEAAGCFELAREMREARAVKPSLAMVDSCAASGGYALGSAASRMIATPSSDIGSIGVYRMHVDLSGAMAQAGVKYTLIHAGEHKVDGHPYAPLPDNVREDMQARADKTWEVFIAEVAISRDMDPEDVRATQAKVYRADEALALNLIDDVSTATEAVLAFFAELDEETEMALDKNDPAYIAAIEEARREAIAGVKQVDENQVAKDAIAADRTRRAAIQSLDEAKDKPKLAATLADTDGMTADTAKVILASAASETVSAPKGKTVVDAMNVVGGAGVIADPGEEDEQVDEESKMAAGLIAAIPATRRLQAVK